MKGMIRLLMLVVMASVLFASCDEKNKELKEQVVKFNNECPISYGDIMTINSVFYEDHKVTMKILFNENIATANALNNHKEDAKENLCLSLTKSTSERFLDEMINTNTQLCLLFVGNQLGERAEFIISPQEMKQAKEKYQNMTEGQKLVVSTVLGTKLHLPKQVDEITKLTNVSITSSALVYKYEINDRELGKDLSSAISLMKEITKSRMAGSIKQGVLAERNRQFYKALTDNNQSVKVEYFEKNTRNRALFNISVSEIRDILNGKYQNDAITESEWNDLAKAIEELEDMYGDLVDTTAIDEYEEIDFSE